MAAEAVILPTTDPESCWAVRFAKGRVHWAKRDCAYANEHALLIRLREERIVYLKDYFNPLAFYRALDLELPAFRYDPNPDAPMVRMPAGVSSALTEEENIQRVLANFINPIDFDPGLESIYANDIVMVCPNAPSVSYTHLDVYKRQALHLPGPGGIQNVITRGTLLF